MGYEQFLGAKAQGAVRIGDNVNLLDGETIVIGDKTYEWEVSGGVTPGNVAVTKGVDAPTSITNLRDAINANKPSIPVTAYVDPVSTSVLRIEADSRGAAGNLAFTHTMTDPDNILSGTLLTGGENALTQTQYRGAYTVTALDVLAGNVMIATGGSTPRYFQLECRSSTGVFKAITSIVALVGAQLKIDFDGATNPIAGDILHWRAWE